LNITKHQRTKVLLNTGTSLNNRLKPAAVWKRKIWLHRQPSHDRTKGLLNPRGGLPGLFGSSFFTEKYLSG
jgi:hypothetical protein